MLRKGQTWICNCGHEMDWLELTNGEKRYTCGECGEVTRTIVITGGER
jgi:hypothetical protein